ncbi:MAG: Nif11-like leader peptide family RiPP precursor [Ruminiclostridium sp.]|nr:Nif11-like leader peptide family RiPP precursor [Ruminiclostridium sp.]
MSKEIAKKLIAELQTNEELKAKIASITDQAEMVKIAAETGYDVTLEEMLEAEKEYRAEMAHKSDELSADELEAAAGGRFWKDEENKDGKEFNCYFCNLGPDYQAKNEEYCNVRWYCENTNVSGKTPNYGCPFKER